MSEPSESDYACEECGADVDEDDDFCPGCGVIFRDDVRCSIHSSQLGKGVCLICGKPYCEECGTLIGKLFFCQRHSAYDIYEGSACVFDSTENRIAHIAFQSLQEGGFHPFAVLRAIVPVTSIGRLTPNMHVGPHLVLVPFGEVQGAEELLTKLGIRQQSTNNPEC
jgi:hypothetical protein